MPTEYGYGRVSHRDQNEVRQVLALEEVGIPPGRRYIDKQSGKDFKRPEYRKLIRKLRQGDTLFVKSIDRLGRNYNEILRQWNVITKQIGAEIVVLDMPLLDTRKKEKDLTGTFVADLVLQILSYVAQTERENIRRRQEEGIAAAKAQGVKFGRPEITVDAAFIEVVRQWRARELTQCEALGLLNISRATLYRKIQSYGL